MESIIPNKCTTGTDDRGTYQVPLAYVEIFQDGLKGDQFYEDRYNRPVMIEEYLIDKPLEIFTAYYWHGSPRRDYTVKVYSVDSAVQLFDKNGETNMLHTDGTLPSEFDYIKQLYPDGGRTVQDSVDNQSGSAAGSLFSTIILITVLVGAVAIFVFVIM